MEKQLIKSSNINHFYLYGKTVKKYDSLNHAMNEFKNFESYNGYKSLGIEYSSDNGIIGSCDFIIKKDDDIVQLSLDYKKYNVNFDYGTILDPMSDAYYFIMCKYL